MARTIDVRTEVRRLVDSKPVYAAAGVGVLASEAIRELPARLARLREEAQGAPLSARATGYVSTARARALAGYEKLALRGQQVLQTRPAVSTRNGKTK